MKVALFSDKLIVTYKKQSLTLNKRIIDQQNCWKNLERIKALYLEKMKLYEKLQRSRKKETLKDLDVQVTQLEFNLQDLWGFERDARYHRFWERPKCKCSKLDNSDSYPYIQYINGNCPLHGNE